MEKKNECFLCQHKAGGICVSQDPSHLPCDHLLHGESFCQRKNCQCFHNMGYHIDNHGDPIVVCDFSSTNCWVGKRQDCTNPKCRAGLAGVFERKCKNCRCNKIHLHTITSLLDLCYDFCKKHNLIPRKKVVLDDHADDHAEDDWYADDFDFM